MFETQSHLGVLGKEKFAIEIGFLVKLNFWGNCLFSIQGGWASVCNTWASLDKVAPHRSSGVNMTLQKTLSFHRLF